MKQRRIGTSAAVLLLAAWGTCAAQPSPLVRGEEMEKLAFLLGEWDGKVTRFQQGGRTLNVEESLSYRWDLGGPWLRGQDRTTLPGGKVIHNQMWITWDDVQKAYRGGWLDNVFPAIVTFEGRWLDARHLVLDSGLITIRGRSHQVTRTYTFISKDEYRTELRMSWDSGRLNKVGEGHYRRSPESKHEGPPRGES